MSVKSDESNEIHIFMEDLASCLHMLAGLRILAYQPSSWHPRGVRMASCLPHGFCIASAWLPGDPDDSRQLPDQLHVGSSLAPNVFGTVRKVPQTFAKLSAMRKPPGSFAEDAEALKKGGMSWRYPQDNADSLPKVSRSSFPHPNFALDQNIDAENSPSPEGAETRGSVPVW